MSLDPSFYHMRHDPSIVVYQPNAIFAEPVARSFGYQQNIVDPAAPQEISEIFEAYTKWKWA
jgi:hypothetical protein